jgi:hypothetical protein
LSGTRATIPAFERQKTVHALDRTATVIGMEITKPVKYLSKFKTKQPQFGVNEIWEYTHTQQQDAKHNPHVFPPAVTVNHRDTSSTVTAKTRLPVLSLEQKNVSDERKVGGH